MASVAYATWPRSSDSVNRPYRTSFDCSGLRASSAYAALDGKPFTPSTTITWLAWCTTCANTWRRTAVSDTCCTSCDTHVSAGPPPQSLFKQHAKALYRLGGAGLAILFGGLPASTGHYTGALAGFLIGIALC